MLFLAEHLGVTQDVATALTWGLVGTELGMGLGLILSSVVSWLRPLGAISLALSVVSLALLLLVDDLRACNCFGVLGAHAFLPKLVAVGVLVYLSALVAWPKPPKIPQECTESFTEILRRPQGPGPDLATPPGPGTIARSPEAHPTSSGEIHRPRGREHTPR
jgi:hypothetical protein